MPWKMGSQLLSRRWASSQAVHQPAPLFQHHEHKSKVIQDHTTSIMGRFQCRNHKCSTPSWSSKKIAIQIREFAGNTYDAVVYKQRCRTCGNLGAMRIDEESYVERVAYRLKKWAGVPMETPEYNEWEEGPSHESSLCEGCKAGHCPMLKKGWLSGTTAHTWH